MKKSKAETALTRQRIVETAAQELHRKGVEATVVSEVMSAAGLTRGGFYRHFDSKEQLIAEACSAGLKAFVARAESAACEGDGQGGVNAIIEDYLSFDHRDDQFGGCPLASLGSELARANGETRLAATEGLVSLIDMIAQQSGHRNRETARSDALFAVSALVGAVTLSRIATDPDLSAALLTETKRHLEQGYAQHARRHGRGRRSDTSREGLAVLAST